MNVLLEINHPAHVHYYRNLASELDSRGHKVVWAIKDIDIVKKLLTNYGFRYYTLPKKTDRIWLKVFKQFGYIIRLLRICRKENIDLAVGTSVTIPHISLLTNTRSIVFDDDDDMIQPLVTRFSSPFASTLLSPVALSGSRKRSDTVYFPGFMELAYLHPNRFNPDPSVLKEVDITPGENYFILRFNAFKAHHDNLVKGLSLEQKLQLVEVLNPFGKVLITTEREIEPELSKYMLTISPHKIHSLMSYSKLLVGDSQTMTSEAAIMGIPAIKCNTLAGNMSVPNALEEYGLCYSYSPENFNELVEKVVEILSIRDVKSTWRAKQRVMLESNIDVTAFMVWFVENYPQSVKELKEESGLWKKFF